MQLLDLNEDAIYENLAKLMNGLKFVDAIFSRYN